MLKDIEQRKKKRIDNKNNGNDNQRKKPDYKCDENMCTVQKRLNPPPSKKSNINGVHKNKDRMLI